MKLIFFLLSIEIFSSLLLEESFSSITNDIMECASQTDATKCQNKKFETKTFQCCNEIKKSTKNGQTSEESVCTPTINPIKPAQDEVATDNGKIMLKEYFGFQMFVGGRESENIENISNEYKITCQDGNFNFKVESQDYTEEEKKKFNNTNHCFNFDRDQPYKNPDKETCLNSILSTAGKGSGVSCGYFKYEINFNDSTTGNGSLCFLFNENIIKNKNIGFMMKQLLTALINNKAIRQEKELSNFKLIGTNSKGSSFTYYSSNDNFIVNGDSNYQRFLGYNYLLLIFLFLI